MLGVLAGHDPSDASSVDVPVPDYLAALTGDLTGLRIGVDQLSRIGGAHEDPALPAVFDAAIAVLADRGAEIVDVELPFYAEMTAADMVIMCSEALAYHLPDLQTSWADYFAGTRAMVGTGALYSAADYVQAQRARRVGQKALATMFADIDLLVTPTSGAGAMAFTDLDDMIKGAGSGAFGAVYTPYWDTAGNPVLVVPMGNTGDGLPLSLQIAGRPFDEPTVLRAGDAFQQATTWHRQVPELQAVAA
jgi:aspartyl-tRNA(Asn)/glutamyl-tRNA(Gln) amidotransferase subunit A